MAALNLLIELLRAKWTSRCHFRMVLTYVSHTCMKWQLIYMLTSTQRASGNTPTDRHTQRDFRGANKHIWISIFLNGFNFNSVFLNIFYKYTRFIQLVSCKTAICYDHNSNESIDTYEWRRKISYRIVHCMERRAQIVPHILSCSVDLYRLFVHLEWNLFVLQAAPELDMIYLSPMH